MRSGSIITGIVLILVGIFFLISPLFPNLFDGFDLSRHWPLIVVGAGILFLVGDLFNHCPDDGGTQRRPHTMAHHIA